MSTAQHEVISADQVARERQERRSVIVRMAGRYGVEADKMLHTLRSTVFKGDVSNEQMMMLLVVADQHGLNPFTKEIYAFPDPRHGIVPIVGVDGWARIINEHPEFDGMEFQQDDASCTCTIYRKDRSHPIAVTEYLEECKRGTQPWNSHPKRMLRHKAMIQCARLAFSFAGIYDPDEAEAIVNAEPIDITPAKDEQAAGGKIGPKKMRQIVEAILKAVEKEDTTGFLEVRDELENEEWLQVWSTLRSWERTAIKKFEAEARAMSCGMNLDGWCKTLLQNEKTLEGIEAAWAKITAAYEANDIDEVPNEVHAFYTERKESMQ